MVNLVSLGVQLVKILRVKIFRPPTPHHRGYFTPIMAKCELYCILMCDTCLDSSWKAEQMLKNNLYPKTNFYPPKWGKTETSGSTWSEWHLGSVVGLFGPFMTPSMSFIKKCSFKTNDVNTVMIQFHQKEETSYMSDL